MCDTFFASGKATVNGSVLLAKNADTEINEAQHLVRFPARDYPKGAAVRVSHIVIPQARHTHEIIMDKSFWTFGGEIGVNEHGLAIGNEAVFSNQTSEKDGVILIDILRLILERAANCDEAVGTVADILDRFGQGGNCELRGNSHFDGSFLVSDRIGAVIIETAGKNWACRPAGETDAISNIHCIASDWEDSSLTATGAGSDFKALFSDEATAHNVGANERRQMSFDYLADRRGEISVRTMADLLRYTGEGDYHPMQGERPVRICMHAAPYENRLWQATGALISDVRDGVSMAWVTATSGTDVSIFKPVFCGVDFPDLGPMPRESLTEGAYWWHHEFLHRRVMADYSNIAPEIRADFESLEDRFFSDADSVMSGSIPEKQAFVTECWRLADEAESRWLRRLEKQPYIIADESYARMWDAFNRAAAIEMS